MLNRELWLDVGEEHILTEDHRPSGGLSSYDPFGPKRGS